MAHVDLDACRARHSRGAHRRPAAVSGRGALLCAALLLVVAVGVTALTTTNADAADGAVTVSPTTALVDGQMVDVDGSGLNTGVTYVIVECGPDAITLEFHTRPDGDVNPEDGCESQQTWSVFTGDGSTIHSAIQVLTVLNTATGSVDCRNVQCFVALFPLAGSASLVLKNLTFSANACATAGSCVTGTRPGVAGNPVPEPARSTPAPPVQASATAGSPVTLTTDAGLAGDLTVAGAITGEVTGAFSQPVPPVTPVRESSGSTSRRPGRTGGRTTPLRSSLMCRSTEEHRNNSCSSMARPHSCTPAGWVRSPPVRARYRSAWTPH